MVKTICLNYKILKVNLWWTCQKAVDLITRENCIIIFKEHLKQGFDFPLPLFFLIFWAFVHCSVAQLHLNSWRILVYRAICKGFPFHVWFIHIKNDEFYSVIKIEFWFICWSFFLQKALEGQLHYALVSRCIWLGINASELVYTSVGVIRCTLNDRSWGSCF